MSTWLRPMPAGRPYQQLGRTDVHRWWRPVLGAVMMAVFCIVAIVGVIAVLVALTWASTGKMLEFGTEDEFFIGAPLQSLVALIGSLALLLPAVWLVVLVVERRGIGTLSSVVGRIRWRWMALSFIPAFGYIVIVFGVSFLADSLGFGSGDDDPLTWAGWHAFWPPLLLIVLLVPFQAAAEEYVFRGWLLQAIGSCTFETRTSQLGRLAHRVFRTPWPAILLTSALFVAGHGYTDWGPVDIGVFALATCWVVILTGGLEAGIALHIVNNVAGMAFDASQGHLSLEQGSIGFTDFVMDAVPMVLWAIVIVWMFRHTGSKRLMNRPS